MSDFSKDILEKIKKEQIQPKPRWHFLTKNYFFWFMFILTTILGGISFGMIFFILNGFDWDIYTYLGVNFPKAIIVSLPYLWILILFLFIFITYYNFIHTRTGYRYRFLYIFLISLLLSSLLGYSFYQNGLTEIIESQLRLRMPGYHRMVLTGENQWMQPDKGLLVGIITEIDPDNKILFLEDPLNQSWRIDINQSILRGNAPLSPGARVRLIGKKLQENSFKASEVRIMPRGPHMGRGMQK